MFDISDDKDYEVLAIQLSINASYSTFAFYGLADDEANLAIIDVIRDDLRSRFDPAKADKVFADHLEHTKAIVNELIDKIGG